LEFTKKLKESETKLDGIINNGGALPTYQVMKNYKNDKIEETIAVHLISPFIICHELHPLLSQTNGRILNNTSAGAYSQGLNMPIIKNNFNECLKKDTLYHDGALVYA
jgi:NAD(P)-dependent dehydrogenase (short-subunit alcohol dehydrogenase family)